MTSPTRSLLSTVPLVALVVLLLVYTAQRMVRADAAAPPAPQAHKLTPPPGGKPISVAFVLTENATMIDFAGPWEVFQDTMLGSGEAMQMPFQLYTVSASRNPIHATGGMTIVPDYTFDDAPAPRIVVVPAQQGRIPQMMDWLRRMDKQADVVMSVCTGAFQLGAAGLLDGKPATTHHQFYDRFQQSFPQAKLVRGQRYVQSDDVLYTAGGLTSGIDLALHIVEQYYGRDVALATARYMEYESARWQQ